MLKLVGFIFFVSLSVAKSASLLNEPGVPTFKWDENERNKLHVTFADGFTDTVNLKHSYPEDLALNEERARDSRWCMYKGHFESDVDAYIAVNGCPGSRTLDVGISSRRSNGHLFKVENDQVSRVSGLGDESTVDGIIPLPELESDAAAAVENMSQDRALPSSLKLNLFYLYDDNFNARFKTNANSEATMKKVTNLASATFQFSSLGTTVELNVAGYKKVRGSYLADRNLSDVANAIGDMADSAINTYVMFGTENKNYGTLGMAYVGTVCYPDRYIRYRTAVVEYTRNDAVTAHVLSHELGHSLNMRHDFVNKTIPRTDSKGNNCTNINGVMDYNQAFYDKWSTCSVEDLKKLNDRMVARTGKFCIDASISPTPNNPSFTTSTTTTTTIAPPCVDAAPEGFHWCTKVPDRPYWCDWYSDIAKYCKKSCKTC